MFRHCTIFLSVLAVGLPGARGAGLSLGRLFADGLVLQGSAPCPQHPEELNHPRVWGRGDPGDAVTANIKCPEFGTDSDFDMGTVAEDGTWSGHIDTMGLVYTCNYTMTVTATSPSGVSQEVVITDMRIGEVWVCSGQSNMRFQVRQVRDAEMEIEKAAGYSDIRLTKISSHWSDTPLDEPEAFDSLWAKTSDAASTFSAVCLFFAEQIQDELAGIPIGLIDATWGGTIIEAWSPPEALEACDVADEGTNEEQNHNNYLWNGMIQPLTQMSIRGALWYQGEANTGHNKEIYDCTFENLISSWRQRWNDNTEGLTDELFPFGFVQLAPNRDNRNNFNWPIVRWKQTGEVGYVPNEKLEYVFMAAAMDDDIDLHPKNKRLPSSRLAWAALNLVYGAKYDEDDTSRPPLAGPQPLGMTTDESGSSMTVQFSQELEEALREEDRFMVCCLSSMDECDQAVYGEGWVGVPITGMGADSMSVSLDTSNTGCDQLSGLAYLWLETPCAGEAACPLYSADQYRLPVAPFRMAF